MARGSVEETLKELLKAVGEVFPEAKYQRCVVHFYRNVFSVVSKSKTKNVAKMIKTIHAQERKKTSREKAALVVANLKAMKLPEAAKKAVEETPTHCDFPSEYWTKIRTNNVIERKSREIQRRTRVVGAFQTEVRHLCWFASDYVMWPELGGAARNT